MKISMRNVVRLIGVSLVTVVFLTLILTSVEGESNALMSINATNQFKNVKNGDIVIHEIIIENDIGNQPVFVEFFANITSVSEGGEISHWTVRFMDGDNEILNVTLDPEEKKTIGAEIYCDHETELDEQATTVITAWDAYHEDPPVYEVMNATRTCQNELYGDSLTLVTRRAQNYEPRIELASGADIRQTVNPLTPTTFKINVTNMGLKMDTIRLLVHVGSPIRGETRATGSWKIIFSPTSFIQDLNSYNEGVGYFTIVYVNITAPSSATYGDYPITITAASQLSNKEDFMNVKAVIPIPDLSANEKDIEFSKYPAMEGEELSLNVTIHNDGGALEKSFRVFFWIEDPLKEGSFILIDQVEVSHIDFKANGTAEVTFIPLLGNNVNGSLTSLDIRIIVDADGEIIEADEDNNRVDHQLDILPETEPPTLTISSPENHSEVSGSITISGTASDNIIVRKIEYQIADNTDWFQASGTNSWSIVLDTSQYEDGELRLKFRAYDGRQYSDVQTLNIMVKNHDHGTDDTDFIPLFGYFGIFECAVIFCLAASIKLKRGKLL